MDYSGLSIQRATVSKTEDSNTLDITYFATDHNEEEILNPIMEDTDLKISDLKKNEVILDSSFKEDEGIQVGDQVIDKTSKQKLKVVAFAKMQKYGYSEIGFISSDTYTGMRQKQIQAINGEPKPLWPRKASLLVITASNLMVTDKKQWSIKFQATRLKIWRYGWLRGSLACFFISLGSSSILTLQKLETVRGLEGHWHVHEPDYLVSNYPSSPSSPHRSAAGAWLWNHDGAIFT